MMRISHSREVCPTQQRTTLAPDPGLWHQLDFGWGLAPLSPRPTVFPAVGTAVEISEKELRVLPRPRLGESRSTKRRLRHLAQPVLWELNTELPVCKGKGLRTWLRQAHCGLAKHSKLPLPLSAQSCVPQTGALSLTSRLKSFCPPLFTVKSLCCPNLQVTPPVLASYGA